MGDNSQEFAWYLSVLDTSRVVLRLFLVIAVVFSSLLIDGLDTRNADAAVSPRTDFSLAKSVVFRKSELDAQSKSPMISICVVIDTSLLRDPGKGGCRPNMEFSIRWSASSAAPQMCMSKATRYLLLATAGRCLLAGTIVAKPNKQNKNVNLR